MPYRMNIVDVEEKTFSNLTQGLNDEEALARLKEHGKNELIKQKKETILELFFDQLKDPMVIILLAGALISIFLGEYLDSGIILIGDYTKCDNWSDSGI